MIWRLSHRADPVGVDIADRHYNRQKVGAPQFVPPGRCLVLRAETDRGRALWVTSFPFPEYVKHRWPGWVVNSLFRNEGAGLSSDLILDALAATRWRIDSGEWPEAPGMVTFVKAGAVRSTNPGYCYLQAGFTRDGFTEGGLHALVHDLAVVAHQPLPAPAPLFDAA